MAVKFEQRHYEAVAEVVKAMPDETNKADVAYHLARMFSQDNSRFNRQRFMTAAGIDGQW